MPHLGPTTASEIGDLLGLPATEIEKALLRMESSGAILRGSFRTAAIAPETEWCERRLLARIHRLTVATLRKQIEPVKAAQFMTWLLRWQHLAPGTQVRGEHGTLEVIRQLQGFEIPASAWERFVLARRISDYDPAHLDQLCLTGAVGWGRLSPHPATLEATGTGENGGENRRRVIPTRVAPIAFFVREDADWLRPHHPGAEDSTTSFLSPVAQALLDLLKHRGALFFPDMVRATGRLKAEVETGLWELVAAGLVTADGFENLRALVTPKSASGGSLARVTGKVRRPRHAPGRWSLLHTEGADRDRIVESCCWMLLRRYGVVFRDLLVRETNLPRWRELQIGYRRLEDRGEVRGGRFVDGFLGEQFALPVAVESLRAHRKLPQNVNAERVVIAAADPLNLVGIIVPGERIPAISGRSVTFRDGAWEAEDALQQAASF
jgi:ATP-dependent helicase Lhr and Lhr-like helicase